ncbi:MAG: YceI family protein [Bacteroidia bacterium]
MKKIKFYHTLIFLLLLIQPGVFYAFSQSQLYTVSSGNVNFTSEAPLELIKASSQNIKGLIDPAKRTFAFSIEMKSFHGFNSPLQQEHFNERYLETDRFPQGTFSGKIIEDIDFEADGSHEVRAKGMLTIHGVAQERIMNAKIMVKDNVLTISSSFLVPLKEHEISIPKIVYQKIAQEIQVEMHVELKKL